MPVNEANKSASSAEEVKKITNEVKNAIQTVSEKATDSALVSEEITKRADGLLSGSISSQKNANDICNNTSDVLSKAINEAKKVEEISWRKPTSIAAGVSQVLKYIAFSFFICVSPRYLYLLSIHTKYDAILFPSITFY